MQLNLKNKKFESTYMYRLKWKFLRKKLFQKILDEKNVFKFVSCSFIYVLNFVDKTKFIRDF